MHKNTLTGLVLAVVLSSSLTACKDTRTLQENEQLKAQVAELQKENGQLGNTLEAVTAARDALTTENEALQAQIKGRKKPSGTKASSRKRRQSRRRPAAERRHGLERAQMFFVVGKGKEGCEHENV
jgi:FtsZ-binding cell division protein ZapB